MQILDWGHAFGRHAVASLRLMALLYPALIMLELLAPRGVVSWASRAKGALFQGFYLVAAALVTTASQALVHVLGLRSIMVFHLPADAPPALTTAAAIGAALMAVLMSDFFQYWCHRAQHTTPFLWRMHAVHHSIRDLNAVNSFNHWGEEVVRLPFITIPIAILAPEGLGWAAWVPPIFILQAYYQHTATRLSFGWFCRILADNRFHRLHHSIQPEHRDKNFGVVTPLWDMLFGTAVLPQKDQWPDTGVEGMLEERRLLDYLALPHFRPAEPQPAMSQSA